MISRDFRKAKEFFLIILCEIFPAKPVSNQPKMQPTIEGIRPMADKKSNNPPCRHCGGRTNSPKQLKRGGVRYRCQTCKRYTTIGDDVVWGTPKGDTPPLTSTERSRRYNANLTPEQKAERVERNRLRRLQKRRQIKQSLGERITQED